MQLTLCCQKYNSNGIIYLILINNYIKLKKSKWSSVHVDQTALLQLEATGTIQLYENVLIYTCIGVNVCKIYM